MAGSGGRLDLSRAKSKTWPATRGSPRGFFLGFSSLRSPPRCFLLAVSSLQLPRAWGNVLDVAQVANTHARETVDRDKMGRRDEGVARFT